MAKLSAPSPERSRIMRAIKSADTRPEVLLRQLLWRLGYRFCLHSTLLPGRPDIVFPAKRVAIFVHGCFWHHHSCQKGRMPRQNVDFWTAKIAKNIDRDHKVQAELRTTGWEVVVVWECELANQTRLLARLLSILGQPRTTPTSR
jgi:DNA mismatch endonuclease, patch repair protein